MCRYHHIEKWNKGWSVNKDFDDSSPSNLFFLTALLQSCAYLWSLSWLLTMSQDISDTKNLGNSWSNISSTSLQPYTSRQSLCAVSENTINLCISAGLRRTGKICSPHQILTLKKLRTQNKSLVHFNDYHIRITAMQTLNKLESREKRMKKWRLATNFLVRTVKDTF